MKQRICLIVLLLFVNAYNFVQAQDYGIKTLEGSDVKVHLSEKSGHILAASYLKDSLFLIDYRGGLETRVLRNKFLLVTYDTRSGSGLALKTTLLLLVGHNKMQVAIVTTSYANLVSNDKKGIFQLKFNIIGTDKSNYKLIISVNDQQESKLHPENSYNNKKEILLNFDQGDNIFYGLRKRLNQAFMFVHPTTFKPIKQQLNGIYSVVSLGRNDSYFIKGEWYSGGYDNQMFKYYAK